MSLGDKKAWVSHGLFSFRVRTTVLLVCVCVVCVSSFSRHLIMTFRNPFLKTFLDCVTGCPGGVQDTLVPMAYLASQWIKLDFGTAVACRQQAWAGEHSWMPAVWAGGGSVLAL